MKKIFFGIAFAALLALAFFAGSRYGGDSSIGNGSGGSRKVLYYIDPMNPGHRYEKPGIAPCGMPLEPIYADGGSSAPAHSLPGTVLITPDKQQLIGIKVEKVERSASTRTIRLLGKVAADETRVYQLNSSVAGWIREVTPYATGSLVKKGTTLASFYAPEFLAAEQAYVYSLSSTTRRPTFKVGSAQPNLIGQTTQQYEDNLRNLGMGENQIKELARTQEFQENIRIESPVTGFILRRNISPGFRFDKGNEFYLIADLRKVWILLDAYEDEAKYFHPGDVATVRYQGREIKTKVSDVLPPFDPVSRTLKVRLIADNPKYLLRPEMFVDVEFPVQMPPAIVIPVDAVIDTGLKKTVFVDKGNGVFEPRTIETGNYIEDRVEILKGLMPGENIVVSGNFFIDSESRMKSPSQGMSGETSVDPSCGMMVNEEHSKAERLTSKYREKTYYFCSPECKEEFDKAPHRFTGEGESPMPATTGKPAGRAHDRMKMQNHKHDGMPMPKPVPMPAGKHPDKHMDMPTQMPADKAPGDLEMTGDKPAAQMHEQMKMDKGGDRMYPPAKMDGTTRND